MDSPGMVGLPLLLLLSGLSLLCGAQHHQPWTAKGQQPEASDWHSSAGTGRAALAAPTSHRGQLQSANSVVLNGEQKPFIKIHYRDGIQKAIFDETQRRVPPEFEDNNDIGPVEFDAYEDNRLTDPRHEAPLFVPPLYRNESEEEQTTVASGRPAPAPAAASRTGPRPLGSPETQGKQPIGIRTTTARPFTIRPAQPFGRPPPPPPQQFLPQQPRPPPPPQQGFLPPQQPPKQLRPPAPNQPSLPQQPFQPPPPPLTGQPLPRPAPSQPQLPPPRPAQPQQPPTAAPGPGNIRTGVCRQSIFYTPSAPSLADLQRVYTHFAVVLSVDQCARTCHEFNCDAAILDPRSRHCQFNPSTAFRLPAGCPRWPNPLYRNNVAFGQELLKLQCVSCQPRRRVRPPGGGRAQQQQQNVLQPNGLGAQQQSFNVRQPQFVLRTTNRDRIGTDNELAAGGTPIQRVANAAKLHNPKGNEPKRAAEGDKELSEEFRKLERLLKSTEDYLDEADRGKGGGRGRAREVPSWAEGHPQGDGFSPLKINPLRRPILPLEKEPAFPPPGAQRQQQQQPIFHSTDALPRKFSNFETDDQLEERLIGKEFARRRTRRESGIMAEDGGGAEGEELAAEWDKENEHRVAGRKPKLDTPKNIKLTQGQGGGPLRELPEEDGQRTARQKTN